MWEVKFQERSSQGQHAPTFSNLNNNGIFGILVTLPFQQYQYYEDWPSNFQDMMVQSLVAMPVFAENL
jgi:hypothetical protein